MRKKINLGIVGLGTVGKGVVELLRKNRSVIEQRVGTEVCVMAVCDKNPQGLNWARKNKLGTTLLTRDFREIIQNQEIDIVIELIGGYEPARTIILDSISRGKHIVTANKALLAKHWIEIFSQAKRHNVLVYFEASVGAGIPVVQALNEGLCANRIRAIFGILNGTTNYILTRMTKEGVSFAQGLVEARKAGFAEADPSLDLQGIDTQHKLAILGSIAFGTQVNLDDIYCEGIVNTSQEDISYGRSEFGYILKLLGILKVTAGGIDIRVHPTFVPERSLLATVDWEYNGIYIIGDAVGKTMFYGKGAGQMPAASAVVSDIIYLSRNVYNDIAGRVPYVVCDPGKRLKILPIDEVETKYYIRFTAVDRPGVLSKISGVLGKNGVSIASVFQKEGFSPKGVPIIMVTHKAKEGSVKKALREIDGLDVVRAKSKFIRIEEDV